MGIGAHDRGSFTQDGDCQTASNSSIHRGMYAGFSTHAWGNAGYVYVR